MLLVRISVFSPEVTFNYLPTIFCLIMFNMITSFNSKQKISREQYSLNELISNYITIASYIEEKQTAARELKTWKILWTLFILGYDSLTCRSLIRADRCHINEGNTAGIENSIDTCQRTWQIINQILLDKSPLLLLFLDVHPPSNSLPPPPSLDSWE